MAQDTNLCHAQRAGQAPEMKGWMNMFDLITLQHAHAEMKGAISNGKADYLVFWDSDANEVFTDEDVMSEYYAMSEEERDGQTENDWWTNFLEATYRNQNNCFTYREVSDMLAQAELEDIYSRFYAY
jgi:hypothetical protein